MSDWEQATAGGDWHTNRWPMTLVEFLLARIAEDEAIAARAADFEAGRWSAHRDDADLRWYVRSENHGPLLTTGYVGNGDSKPYAENIARWDPARVLAESAAKRAIIALPDLPGQDPEAAKVLDEAILFLAQPYADHPDFDPAWRPA